MLIDSKLPKELWPESINTAIYIINRSPTTSNPGKISPFSLFTTTLNRPNDPCLDFLRAFGATTFVHIPPRDSP